MKRETGSGSATFSTTRAATGSTVAARRGCRWTAPWLPQRFQLLVIGCISDHATEKGAAEEETTIPCLEPARFRQQSLETGIRLVQHVLPSLRRDAVKGVAPQLKRRLCRADKKRVTSRRRTAPKIK